MKEIFDQILKTFENDDIRKFAEMCIESAPEYWHHVAASSSGKYHPPYSLGEGGLVRHSIAVVRFLNHMFGVESISNQFTSRERDLLRVAAITHDMQKSGTQGDFEKSKWTKFDHPLRIAKIIRDFKGSGVLPDDEIELVAHAVESHMGAFNTDKHHPGVVLPKPTDKYQIILHLADYLASRKDIEMVFESHTECKDPEIFGSLPQDGNKEELTPENCPVGFGKYGNLTVMELHVLHPDYIKWLQKQDGFSKEPCKSMLIKLGYEF